MSPNSEPPKGAGAHKRLRATHSKSRQGCYTCKSRRVKCNEAKPTCGACALRSEPCSFPPELALLPRRERHGGPAAGPVLAERSTPALSKDGFPHALEFNLPFLLVPRAEMNPTSMNMADLRLFSHFMVRTSKRMSLNPYRQELWETVIPRLAAEHEFIMHLLLALTGLDYFPLDTQPIPDPSSGGAIGSDHHTLMPMGSHLQLTIEHHQCGLQGFRDQLSTLSDSNCNEVFAGSMLLVAFALSSLRVRNWSDSHTCIKRPRPIIRLDWIYLTRGLFTVVEQCWPSLRMGPFREILQYPSATDEWKIYPDAMFTNVTAPTGCSPRISRFCRGAYEALSRLKTLREPTPSSPIVEEGSSPSHIDRPYSALTEGIDLLERIYMRILYVVQLSQGGRDTRHTVAITIQAEMENAAIMGWPQALSEAFLASLGSPDVLPNASLVVLAHLYLTLALFEATWFLNGSFDEEIIKIDALFKVSCDKTFIALMAWPVSVLNG